MAVRSHHVRDLSSDRLGRIADFVWLDHHSSVWGLLLAFWPQTSSPPIFNAGRCTLVSPFVWNAATDDHAVNGQCLSGNSRAIQKQRESTTPLVSSGFNRTLGKPARRIRTSACVDHAFHCDERSRSRVESDQVVGCEFGFVLCCDSLESERLENALISV